MRIVWRTARRELRREVKKARMELRREVREEVRLGMAVSDFRGWFRKFRSLEFELE